MTELEKISSQVSALVDQHWAGLREHTPLIGAVANGAPCPEWLLRKVFSGVAGGLHFRAVEVDRV